MYQLSTIEINIFFLTAELLVGQQVGLFLSLWKQVKDSQESQQSKSTISSISTVGIMSFRYSTRQKKKKTLSEQLDIGAGKYVHDVQFSSTYEKNKIFSYNGLLHRPKRLISPKK